MPEPSHLNPAGLRVAILGSGSAGNSTAVTYDSTTVLVDAGFSARETLRRLAESGIDVDDVVAIVVTHEHTDHVRGVRVLAKRLGVPVYATGGTARAASLGVMVADLRTVARGETLRIGSLDMLAFRTSHDAAEPIGLRFDAPDGSSLGLATDTGELTPEALESLANCTALAIECNHDVDMLVNGPYPWFLKKRILSVQGHLSNDDAARGLESLAHDGLRSVVGMHLSTTNNTPGHAHAAIAACLDRIGLECEAACSDQRALRVCRL